MTFLAPSYLHLLWILAIPVALWLFRRKAKRVSVSTLLFFRALAREHNESAWLRTIKKWLSLALTLLAIVLAIFALARPSSEGGQNPGSIVCLIDCSASMAAADGTGTSLEAAKRLARGRIRGLPDSVVVSLIAYSDKPNVLLSRSRNRRDFSRLLDEISSLPIEGNADAALATAKRLAVLDPPSEIWHLSDQPIKTANSQDYRFTNVSLTKVNNVGITGFQIRKAPMARDRFEGFVRVSAANANAGTMVGTLEARIGGRLAQLRELELAPGASSSLILPLEGIRGQKLELELKFPDDCLGWDNAVIAPLPKPQPLIAAWVTENPDPFTELALGSLIEAGSLEVLRGSPKDWPLQNTPDIYIFENWLPPAWPSERPVIALMPPSSSGPLRVRPLSSQVPYESVRSLESEHPILYKVSTARLSLTQTAVINVDGSLQALLLGGTEPLLCAGEANGQRMVVTAFSPSRSERLALLPAYPLLLGNALYWCAERSAAFNDMRPQHTGDMLSTPDSLQWEHWDGKNFTTAVDSAQSSLVKLQRVGMWSIEGDRTGSCILASTSETDVPAQGAGNGTDSPSSVSAGLGWTAFLLWSLLTLLLLESYLFHRQAIY